MTMAGASSISLSTLRQHNFWDAVMRHATRTAALMVLLVLGGVIYTLVEGSLPALKQLGLGFFTSQRWNPVEENLGGLTAIYGTVITAIIAGNETFTYTRAAAGLDAQVMRKELS